MGLEAFGRPLATISRWHPSEPKILEYGGLVIKLMIKVSEARFLDFTNKDIGSVSDNLT